MVRKRLWLILSIGSTLLAGCQSVAQPAVHETAVANALQTEVIESYLVDHLGVPAWDGKVFCSYAILDAEQVSGGYVYLWALCLQQHLEEDGLVVGAGISVPVALQVQEENGNWGIVGYLVPQDGTFFGADVRKIFPKSTWDQILPGNNREINQKNELVQRLEKALEMQAKSYYGL
jgi:hypothetical protein